MLTLSIAFNDNDTKIDIFYSKIISKKNFPYYHHLGSWKNLLTHWSPVTYICVNVVSHFYEIWKCNKFIVGSSLSVLNTTCRFNPNISSALFIQVLLCYSKYPWTRIELCKIMRWNCSRVSLTHWVTHICVSKLTNTGSNNGLSPGRRQAKIWTNAGILLIGPQGTNLNEILIEIHTFSFNKIHLKMSSGKWRPFCLGLHVLICSWCNCSCLNTIHECPRERKYAW